MDVLGLDVLAGGERGPRRRTIALATLVVLAAVLGGLVWRGSQRATHRAELVAGQLRIETDSFTALGSNVLLTEVLRNDSDTQVRLLAVGQDLPGLRLLAASPQGKYLPTARDSPSVLHQSLAVAADRSVRIDLLYAVTDCKEAQDGLGRVAVQVSVRDRRVRKQLTDATGHWLATLLSCPLLGG